MKIFLNSRTFVFLGAPAFYILKAVSPTPKPWDLRLFRKLQWFHIQCKCRSQKLVLPLWPGSWSMSRPPSIRPETNHQFFCHNLYLGHFTWKQVKPVAVVPTFWKIWSDTAPCSMGIPECKWRILSPPWRGWGLAVRNTKSGLLGTHVGQLSSERHHSHYIVPRWAPQVLSRSSEDIPIVSLGPPKSHQF